MSNLIVVINDDLAILDKVQLCLALHGYRSLALYENEAVCRTVKEQQPALVIQDIRMAHPESGWHIIDELWREPTTHHIPVLIMSSEPGLQLKAAQWQFEHCEVLPSPFDAMTLLQKVDALVEQ